MRIHPSVPHRADETPASLVSRLAYLHRAESVRVFSLDMGMPFQSIVDGDPNSMASLADLIGVPVEPLHDAAIVRKDGAFAFRGHALPKSMLRRARTYVCARCVVEDLDGSTEPSNVSARFQWNLDPIRACHRHGVVLTEIAVINSPSLMNDIARIAAPQIERFRCMADEAVETPASALEDYLLDRLDGQPGPEWLDALPWHAAAKVCETIGAVATLGRAAPIKTMSDAQWREAGGAGFDIASQGPAGIRAFFDDLRTTYPQGRSDPSGPQAWFGRIHTWLTGSRLQGFDPLRDIVVEMVAEVSPVGPEDRLYGRPVVDHRRLHSIRTAALETGMHPKRLRRMLASAGVIPADHHGVTDDRIIFAAQEAREFLAKVTHSISERDAQSYLTAGRVQTKVLADAGLIRPFLAPGQDGMRFATYDTRDLDDFIRRLTEGAEIISTFSQPIFRIPDAAKRANCSAAEIVRAILQRRIAWTGQIAGEAGYLSVLVDVNEVRRLVRGEHGDLLPLTKVQDSLNTTFAVVDALVRTGILPSERAISPLNRCPFTAVRRHDLDAFLGDYGSLTELAKEREIHFIRLKKALKASGVEPCFGKPDVPATFYRRAEVSAAI
jgi:hypothetical protein